MTIGIVGAMDVEVASIRGHMDLRRVERRAGMEFAAGEIEGADAVVVRCGVGKVSAAACAQILIDAFGVDAIVNTGVAGSLDAGIDIGDLVVAADVVHHDVDATVFGYALGEVPQLGTVSFHADDALSRAIVAVAESVAQEGEGRGEGFSVHCGRVVSGDRFIVDGETKGLLAERFGGACCEMEGASIAQVCWMNGTPFAIVRCISDKADGSDFMDYDAFEALAAVRCAAVAERAVGLFAGVGVG